MFYFIKNKELYDQRFIQYIILCYRLKFCEMSKNQISSLMGKCPSVINWGLPDKSGSVAVETSIPT